MNPVIISVDPADREAWREQRRHGIGSSDAAAILGMDRFSSPWSVYVDKVEPLAEEEDSAALEWGHRLEDAVAQKFADDHPEWISVKPTCMYRHPEHEFMQSNPDRLLFQADAIGTYWEGEIGGEVTSGPLLYAPYADGPSAINELKTSRLDEDWDGDFPPDRVLIQCQHQMAVQGVDVAYVSALLHGRDYREFVVPRDDTAIDLLYNVEGEFWQRVVDRNPPPVDGSAATSDALKALYAEPVPESEVHFGPEVRALFERRALVKDQAKALELEVEKVDNELRALFGNATVLTVEGEKAASWTPVTTSRFDAKRFAEEHPDLAAQYRKPSSYRRLNISKGFAK